jgi:hypothetical protein
VLEHACGVREDGKWSAFEVGLDVARQNGKGSILEARELIGVFEWGERLVIHSAHEFPTSLEHFGRLLYLFEDTPDLDRQVKRVSRSHGEEGIELMNGNRIRFRTRTKGGGRGFTGDLLVFDEAMALRSRSTARCCRRSRRGRPGNPQVWYAGSAVDQMVHEHGVVFARVRERGLRAATRRSPGSSGRPTRASTRTASRCRSRRSTRSCSATSARGRRRTRARDPDLARARRNELRSMDARTFAVERLGIGDWPATHTVNGEVISVDDWNALVDAQSKPLDPVCFATT